MVEFGIVKSFSAHPGNLYGFMYVMDASDRQTGEEVFFHFNDGRQVGVENGQVVFVGRTPVRPELRTPVAGDRLVFRRVSRQKRLDKAVPWAFADSYERQNELLRPREIKWRIVLKGSSVVGFGHYAGEDFEREREEIIAMLSSGTRTITGNGPRPDRWTSADLDFGEDLIDPNQEQGYERYIYVLQVMQNDKWHSIKQLTPLPVTDDYDDYPDDEYDEYDDSDNEDPLAGDVDPIGGYYEEPLHPAEAHRLSVMRQYGDYTG
ncbi:MAG TPA: hypothetical protein VHD60_01935 [Candidatus Saccharimonadales bacterium]|nr:hypothetical protein [Candidatus Saccharimonadales bacterium]